MSSQLRHGLQMRSCFSAGEREAINWFPGHMAKGMNAMQQKLKSVDCVVEVHDARIPISGRNHLFERSLGLSTLKPHILVLNKMDLCDMRYSGDVRRYYSGLGVTDIAYTNCKDIDSRGIKGLVSRVAAAVQGSERYNRSELEAFNVMVIGIPNVGKSSLINALRAKNLKKPKGTKVGAVPGITTSVLEKIKVCEKPLLYLYDTPGVLTPKIKNTEMGLKLALVASIKDHLVGEDVIADYLLYRLNLEGNHKYVEFFGLNQPTDNIQDLLISAAVRNNWVRKVRDHTGVNMLPDVLLVAGKFIKAFRSGRFGKFVLDDVPK